MIPLRPNLVFGFGSVLKRAWQWRTGERAQNLRKRSRCRQLAERFCSVSRTLRTRFREELDRGAIEANSQIAQALFKKASNGDTTAMIFWLKTRAG